MAINNTWSVTNMQHTDADGGVFLIYWSMVAQAMVRHRTLLLKAENSVVSMTLQARPISHMLTLLKPMCLVGSTQVWLKAKKRLMKPRLGSKLTGMQKCKSKLMLRQQLRLVCLGKYLNLALEKGK
jgi:hypothetical protein